MKQQRVWFSWSTGKDSAYGLCRLLQDPGVEVTGIFTTITATFKRVSMHAVREKLLEEQANKLRLRLHKIHIPFPCSNEIYEGKMRELVVKAKANEVGAMAFGDLFLEDIRAYRIKNLKGTGIKPLFPVWGMDTSELARKMINEGFRAVITCIDEKKLAPDFSGMNFDSRFLDRLPPDIDPCGENGEFHSFIYDCPAFSNKIPVAIGEKTSRDGFTFTDILPAEQK